MTILYIGGVIGVLWLASISFFVYKLRRHYSRLLTRTRKTNIDDVLDALLEHDTQFKSEISEIKKSLDDTIKKTAAYYQKVGFIRFNPFERIGGDQSFVLALLDKEDNGILLNFLYTREGVRVYAKPLSHGKAVGQELSSEEKEAIKKAK